ncbi:MAG TPA: TadE/TadG family type IV pilus assembly protein [Bryobacteraceae bacterium]|nr:TadE/TadG family type IV pilus assembly protein [Bryobacteraceae bacterium]
MSKYHQTRRGQRGAAILELALGFLVFFIVLYSIMEFGRVIVSYNILAGAAREGARYAIVHGSASGSAASASDIQTLVREWAIGLDANSIAVTTTPDPSSASPGSTISVKASYTLTPFTGLILDKNITLQSTSQMVVSQ